MTAVNKTNKDFFSHGANILMTKSKVRSITCEVVKKAKKRRTRNASGEWRERKEL